jgi:thioesterase domain-containing protein
MSREATELEALVRQQIPLSRALDYRVRSPDDLAIAVEAPLEPNTNIHGSAFAGSLYALAVLTAWGLCAQLLGRAGVEADRVVADAATGFVSGIRREGRATLAVSVTIDEGPAVRLDAKMHARRRRERPDSRGKSP